MKKYLQKILVLLTVVCFCTGCSRRPVKYQKTDTAMGTIVSQTIYMTGDAEAAEEVTAQVRVCIEELEQKYLSWRLESSEIYKINASAGNGQSMELSGLMTEVFDQCNKVYEASGGAFDFSMGSVARLWNIDSAAVHAESFVLPTQQQLTQALDLVGAENSGLDSSQITLPRGIQLDLGAVGKGIALDKVESVLQEHETVNGAVISVGGSVVTYGSKPDGSLWNVGIVDPFDTLRNIGILSLPGGCSVSTSGDYERYVEVDGVRYHHILDPATGRPADSGVKSVTILYSTEQEAKGLLSDALSTACFVLGVEDGLRLAESFGAEALFVDAQGEIYMTDGMSQFFCLSNAVK